MEIYNKKLFLFIFVVYILGVITSYPLAFMSYHATNKYQFFDFNILYFCIIGSLYAALFMIFCSRVVIKIVIDEKNLVMKFLFRNEKINFHKIQKVDILYPLQKKPRDKRKPQGITITYDGKVREFALLDEKIIYGIVCMAMRQGILIIKKYYEGNNKYTEESIDWDELCKK